MSTKSRTVLLEAEVKRLQEELFFQKECNEQYAAGNITLRKRAEQAEAQAARYREALDKARGIADNFRDYGDALDIVEIIDSAIKEAPDENKG